MKGGFSSSSRAPILDAPFRDRSLKCLRLADGTDPPLGYGPVCRCPARFATRHINAFAGIRADRNFSVLDKPKALSPRRHVRMPLRDREAAAGIDHESS